MSIVEIQNLCKTYPSFQLKNLSFRMEPGRITGFIGRNGAGKTTSIKAMLNLVHPDSGRISFFGMDLIGHEAEIKRRIGYSTGTVSWYPRRKLRELAEVVSPFYDNWDNAAYRRTLLLFQLDENKSPREMSEGMKVKCSLLLALSHHAEVLILDEPTSGLDPFSRDELLDTFLTLRKNGVSVLFSTHIISDIEKSADDILYLSHGQVMSFLPKEELVRTYSQLGETLEQTLLRMERGSFHA